MKLKTVSLILIGWLVVMVGIAQAEWNSQGWTQGRIVDEFDEEYAKCMFIRSTGAFKNSATSGSVLYAEILIYKSKTSSHMCERLKKEYPMLGEDYWKEACSLDVNVGVFLHEYNTRSAAAYFIGDDGYIIMKNTKGEKVTFKNPGKWSNVGLRIKQSDVLVSFFKKSSGVIKVVVSDGHSSRYYFEVTADGFNKLYNSLPYQIVNE